MTFWERAEVFSPILCRLLARKRYGRPLTALEIASGSKIGNRTPLSVHEVEFISQQTRWDKVQFGDMQKFCMGCRLDLESRKAMNPAKTYLSRHPNFKYLRKSPEWKNYYIPMLIRWRGSYGHVTASSAIWGPLRRVLIDCTPMLKLYNGQIKA